MKGAEPTPFRLTICGVDELGRYCGQGVTHVLSILDPGWPEPEPLRVFDVHRRLKLNFHDITEPTAGWIAPERWDVELLLAFGREFSRPTDNKPIHALVHCHAGVSRSTAAAILLLAQHHPERAADEAVGVVARLRPRAWPNLRMVEFGDALLRRDGAIVAAVHEHYRIALERDPWLAEAMIEGGRAREVAAARS